MKEKKSNELANIQLQARFTKDEYEFLIQEQARRKSAGRRGVSLAGIIREAVKQMMMD